MGLATTGAASLATPITVGGTTYFTSYLPPGTSNEASCGPGEGSGRFYAVSLDNAEAVRNYDTTTEELERFEELSSQGIPSAPFFVPDADSGIIWKPDNSGEDTEFPSRMRTFWLESEDGTL